MPDLKIITAPLDIHATAKEIAKDFDLALAVIEQLKGGFSARAPVPLLIDVVKALSSDSPYMSYELTEGSQLYRGRIDNSQTTLSHAHEFSYKPLDKSTSFGRCHQPGSTVFYGSTRQPTVFSELKPEIGDRVHVGIATTLSDNRARVTAIGEIDYSRRYGRPFIGNQTTYHLQDQMLKHLRENDENTHNRVLVADAFFADEFSKDAYRERDYKITACLSEHILSIKISVDGKEIQQDGFAYPSVGHRGSVNFAIAPTSFDAKFRWLKFFAGEIKNFIGFGLYAYKPYAESESIDADGLIHWKDVS